MMLQANKEAVFNGGGLAAAWAFIGVGNWAEAASFASFVSYSMAALVSLLLAVHFVWVKWVRPTLERSGKVRQRKRRASDNSDSDWTPFR